MTDSSLDARCHFNHAHSGFSTLRRSLGAFLKERLALRAVPRGPGPSPTNVRNYRFESDGETRLTEWMRENLLYAHVPLNQEIADTERDLIRSTEPPLNLTGWPNPQKELIQDRRRACVEEARTRGFT
jgi:hypothetical protein